MSNAPRPPNGLHPLIYRIIIGLGVVLILGIYGFAGGNQTYNGLVIVAAILFVVVAIGIPWLLSLIWSRHHTNGAPPRRFRDWLHGEFEIWGATCMAPTPSRASCCQSRPYQSAW